MLGNNCGPRKGHKLALSRSLFTRLALALALALSLLVLGDPQEASAHPDCDSNPPTHSHYHFPFKHRDDWVYDHTGFFAVKWWKNTDHNYFESIQC